MAVRLKTIEISNFKTFIGTSKIGALNQWTAIVAPNGSGKSNFIDAVAFGLGERNNHNLRITHLSELIPRANVAPDEWCQTSVSLQIFSEEKFEKMFKRALVKSSNDHYKSEYWIDEEIVTADNYLRSLADCGINIDVDDFLVYQGKITDIIGMSPKERTELFERASGSIQFKTNYNECKNVLRGIEEKIVANNTEKRKLQKELRKFQVIIDKRNEANDRREELKLMMTEYFLLQLRITELEYEKFQKQEEAADVSLQECRTRNEERKYQMNMPQTNKVKQEEMNKAREQLDELKDNYSLKMSEKSKCDKEVERIKKLIEGEDKRSNNSEVIEAMIKENEKLQHKYSHDLEKYVNVTDKVVLEYRKLDQEIAEQITTSMSQNQIKWLESKHEYRITDCDIRIAAINNSINEQRKIIEAKELFLTDLGLDIKKYEDSIRKMREEREQKLKACLSDEERKRLVQRKQEIDADLENYQVSAETQHKILRQNEISKRLKEQWPKNIYGRIYELCPVTDKKYKLAVATALDRKINAIVVKDDATAIACLEYLRQNKLGLETIYSLDSVKSYDINREYDEQKFQNVKLVYDIIMYDQKYESVVKSIAQSTLVCETFEEACKLWESLQYKRDIVTVAGEMLTRDGVITAGYSERKMQSGKITAINESELRKERETIVNRLAADRMGSLEHSIDEIRLQVEHNNRYVDDLKARREKIIHAKNDAQKELEKLEMEKLELEKKKSGWEKELQDSRSEIHAIRDARFSDFCRKMNITNISEFEKKLRERDNITKELGNISSHLRSLESEKLHQSSRAGSKQIDMWKKNLENLVEKQKKLHSECDELKKKIEEVNTKIKNIERILDKDREELMVVDRERFKLVALERKQKRKKNEARNRKNELINERNEIISAARMENITLPERQRHSSSQSSEDEQKEFDYSLLRDEWRLSESIPQLINEKQKCEEALDNLRLNTINYEFPQVEIETKSLRVKLSKLETQARPIKKRLEEYTKKFENLKKQRYDMFHGFLEKTKGLVGKIYKDLYYPKNAQAALLEENFEEPYLDGIHYDCTPPGTKSDSKNLSGGEKTIGGLALLFALQESHSAPFVIFDEVDGALDPKNIQRLLSYMRKFKSSQQFLMISHNTAVNGGADTILCIAPDMRLGYLKSSPILLARPQYFITGQETHSKSTLS